MEKINYTTCISLQLSNQICVYNSVQMNKLPFIIRIVEK